MQKVFLLLISAIYSMALVAVPAKRERCLLTLKDGSTIEATWMGDETMHFLQTDDGKCLQLDEKGIAHFVDAENFMKDGKQRTSNVKHPEQNDLPQELEKCSKL